MILAEVRKLIDEGLESRVKPDVELLTISQKRQRIIKVIVMKPRLEPMFVVFWVASRPYGLHPLSCGVYKGSITLNTPS